MGLAGVLNREVEQVSTPQYGYGRALSLTESLLYSAALRHFRE
jgi:hypothetical protein